MEYTTFNGKQYLNVTGLEVQLVYRTGQIRVDGTKITQLQVIHIPADNYILPVGDLPDYGLEREIAKYFTVPGGLEDGYKFLESLPKDVIVIGVEVQGRAYPGLVRWIDTSNNYGDVTVETSFVTALRK